MDLGQTKLKKVLTQVLVTLYKRVNTSQMSNCFSFGTNVCQRYYTGVAALMTTGRRQEPERVAGLGRGWLWLQRKQTDFPACLPERRFYSSINPWSCMILKDKYKCADFGAKGLGFHRGGLPKKQQQASAQLAWQHNSKIHNPHANTGMTTQFRITRGSRGG